MDSGTCAIIWHREPPGTSISAVLVSCSLGVEREAPRRRAVPIPKPGREKASRADEARFKRDRSGPPWYRREIFESVPVSARARGTRAHAEF